MTDQDLMPFGKHKGEKMANVPDEYLLFLWNGGKMSQGPVRDYVVANLNAIMQNNARKNR